MADGQIELTIAIEVAHREGIGVPALRGGAQRRLENAIAIAEEHRDGVGSTVGDRQIEHAITIEVADDDGPRRKPGGKGPPGTDERYRPGRRRGWTRRPEHERRRGEEQESHAVSGHLGFSN